LRHFATACCPKHRSSIGSWPDAMRSLFGWHAWSRNLVDALLDYGINRHLTSASQPRDWCPGRRAGLESSRRANERRTSLPSPSGVPRRRRRLEWRPLCNGMRGGGRLEPRKLSSSIGWHRGEMPRRHDSISVRSMLRWPPGLRDPTGTASELTTVADPDRHAQPITVLTLERTDSFAKTHAPSGSHSCRESIQKAVVD